MRKVIDCFMYNGEDEILDLRIEELNSIVDEFWVIEGSHTFTGIPKEPRFEKQALSKNWPLSKMKYYPYTPLAPQSNDPWENEFAQRNYIGNLIEKNDVNDLILFSDVDEIPKLDAVLTARNDSSSTHFGFEMTTHYFKLNFVLVEPPRFAKQVIAIAFLAGALKDHSAQQLRLGIRDQSIPARIIQNAGWHFSYLMSNQQILEKIRAFSHQEFNTPEFINDISVKRTLKTRVDLYLRNEHVWGFCKLDSLPQSVRDNRRKYRRHLYSRKHPFYRTRTVVLPNIVARLLGNRHQ